MKKDHDKKYWYKLDNAGKLYPSIVSTRMSTVFRMSIELLEDVDAKALQAAISQIIERFPYFKVNLRRGLFWYYFEYSDKHPKIEKEKYYPSMFMKYKKKKTFPFRILYYNNYINVEFSHSIADGSGAITFLKTLLIQYFKIKKHIICEELVGAIDIHTPVDPLEFEDSFNKYYKKEIPIAKRNRKAVHFPFPLIEKGKYILLTGIVPIESIKKQAKLLGCTITQLVTAYYFDAIQEYIMGLNKKDKKKMIGRIVINMPVDLRQMFPSKSLKNFFISITPEIDLRLGTYRIEEIVDYLKSYMNIHINEKTISKYISRNVKNEKKILIRILPLWFKNLIMPTIYSRFGERGYTSSISNLGIIKLPKEIEEYVHKFEIFPPPSIENKIKLAIVTYRDNMMLCFGSTVYNTEVEKIFFRKIRKLGIPVKIETNMR
ncbi:MAG: hypothetical protein CVU84_13090 [Firmicutes bacterium HGW-Firmicutes-1]|jgi:hypothetical protein|nr:MAG: hypothetical protein CVU84_13090 [Firmicutes bacterium HGW-Firmicutes-1]